MKFGTSGLRGLASDLIGDSTFKFVFAFLKHQLSTRHIKPSDTIMIAMDYRESSPAISQSCFQAVAAAGLKSANCGTIATPILAAYAQSQGCAAIMITGSHIPADRNGIKFYTPIGEITKADEIAITEIANDLRDFDSSSFGREADKEMQDEALEFWRHRVRAILPKEYLQNWRVGVFEHSTVIRDELTNALEFVGANVVSLGRTDGFVAVDTEAVSENTMKQLKAWAQKYSLDAIVSADGDGDRPLLTDETGTVIRGDEIGVATSVFLNAEEIVTPITSNAAIDRLPGMRVTRTRVGSPYVIEAMSTAMDKNIKVVGFEANGGFLLGHEAATPGGLLPPLATRDCVLPILATIGLAASSGCSLSKLFKKWSLNASVSDRLQNQPIDAMAKFLGKIASIEVGKNLPNIDGRVAKIDKTDGVKFTLDNSQIVHFRASGNAPELRCYCEAENLDKAHELLALALKTADSQIASYKK